MKKNHTKFEHRTIILSPQHQKLRAHFHEFGQVLKETFLDDGRLQNGNHHRNPLFRFIRKGRKEWVTL